jgi:hypothetical protein
MIMLRKLVFLSAMGLLLAMLSPVQAQDGQVLWNFWFGGAINDNIANLLSDGRYPYGPDLVEYSTSFTADKPDKDYYGGRGRAYLTPPETGDYTIWVWSDDSSRVYLSTDENPANAELVASVTGWTPANAWTNYASQKSEPKLLEAGQRYYIEGVYTDGTGGGNIGVGWSGPGIGDDPVIIDGQYLTAYVDTYHPAFQPDPANGATDVTTQLFTWSAGTTAVMHDVYMGTDPNLDADPSSYKGRQPFALYFAMDALTPGAKYYWRVDEVEADGTTIQPGMVWSFTVMPIKAYKLSPYDGALARGLDTKLSWAAGNLAESHNVYFGTDPALVEAADPNVFVGNLLDSMFDPNGLAAGTQYFWRVDEVQSDGTIVAGDVVSFTTVTEGVHGATSEVWLNIGGGVLVSDLTSNPRYPGAPDEVNIVPDFELPSDAADNYGARLRAWLDVPAAGDYTFWVASDDASELWLGDAAWTAVKIAQVNGWTGARAWNSNENANQQSAPIHLEAGKYFLMALMKEGGGGDNLSAAWQGGPVAQQELIINGFIEPYVDLWAECVSPADGEVNVPYCTTLMWKAGVKAAAHKVYLGTDQAAVAAGNASTLQGQFTDTSYTPAPLRWNTTYYWKVVEVNDAEADSPWVGPVWSFNVPNYIALVSAAETLNYDNTADPFVSEAIFDVGALSNFKARGVSTMQLEVKGATPKYTGSPDGTFAMKAAGTDIWGASDEFRYAYKSLTGDGSIVARVVSVGTGSSTWAKAGVMVRASLAGGSASAQMCLTGGDGNGAAFQNRASTDLDMGANDATSNTTVSAAIAPPYYVKVARVGNEVTGFVSADANEWTQVGGAATVELEDPVLIGLAATSHAAGEVREFTFDSVVVDGNVAGDWMVADVGVDQGGNDPAPLFVALVDKAGAVKAVANPGNPSVATDPNWSTWTIPMSSFAGVDLADVNQLIVGVGDGTADGTGSIQFRNVRLMNPTSFSIAVVNPSFEQPGKLDQYWYQTPELARSLGNLPGWHTDSATTGAGFVKGIATNGSWSAYISSGLSLWQLTDHVALEGEVFQLDVDALVAMGGVTTGKNNLKMSLYYLNDAGKRVAIGSASSLLTLDPQPRSLTVTASNVRACIGRKVGIELANIRSENPNVIAVDNVRLKVK